MENKIYIHKRGFLVEGRSDKVNTLGMVGSTFVRSKYRDDSPYTERLKRAKERKENKTVYGPKPQKWVSPLSARSVNKLRHKCLAFAKANRNYCTFVTLTFIQDISGAESTACLNSFLTQVREENKNVNYIWVSELTKKGRIHFHLIVNKYLDVRAYNRKWLKCQYARGLVTNVKKANPLHIEGAGIRGVLKISNYIMKYMRKDLNIKKPVRHWGCSRSISKLFTGKYEKEIPKVVINTSHERTFVKDTRLELVKYKYTELTEKAFNKVNRINRKILKGESTYEKGY